MIESSKLKKLFWRVRTVFNVIIIMLVIVNIEKSVGSNILLKFVRKRYAEISYANSDILNHVNMEKNVISCKGIVVFITTKLMGKTR